MENGQELLLQSLGFESSRLSKWYREGENGHISYDTYTRKLCLWTGESSLEEDYAYCLPVRSMEHLISLMAALTLTEEN